MVQKELDNFIATTEGADLTTDIVSSSASDVIDYTLVNLTH